jgi:hypothetical protein
LTPVGPVAFEVVSTVTDIARRSFAEIDYAALLDATHHYLNTHITSRRSVHHRRL